MPTLPRFLAARAERRFGHPSMVITVEPLSKRFRRVRFAGERLRDRPWQPGHEVEFRVDERVLRHYTPACYHRSAGELALFLSARAGSWQRLGGRVTAGAQAAGDGAGQRRHESSGRRLAPVFGR